jgi:RimJ/RimL family protein N-acetyltransferase
VPTLVPPVFPKGSFSDQTQPRLATGDVEIRPWSDRDAEFVVRAYSDPDIQRWHVRTMDTAEAQAWITARAERWQHEQGADWVVRWRGNPIGRVGLRTVDLEEGRAEVAYWTVPEARGNGLAATALDVLSNWALETVGFHRLDLHHSVDNAASCRVAVKCGYEVEGTARSSVLHGDGWHDMHLHARINRDPEEPSRPYVQHRSA